MDSNIHQTVETNLRDLFFAVIRKIGIVMLVGVVLAGALFGYKFFQNTKDANILDITEKLDNETDMDYAERALNVGRAEDIINSIDSLNIQAENQRQYMAESILMQIDTMNEAVTTANIVVTIDDNMTSGIDRALVSSYSQDLLSGEYLKGLADEMGTTQGYLTELIRVDYAASTAVVVNTDGKTGSAGTITITVVGPSTDLTDKIMDKVLEEVDSQYGELNETMIAHTITLAGRQSSYKIDNSTRDSQYSAANRFGVIQKQIDTYEETLDELASVIGVESKESFYSYFQYNEEETEKSTLGSAIKYAVIGFVMGSFIVLMVIVVNYLFSRKFATQSKFFGHFPGVNKIGVAKPANKRSKFVAFIDRKTDDDNELSVENSIKLMAANVKNLTSGMNKVLFTGTAEPEKIKELVAKLGVNADVKDSIFNNPECLEKFSDYEGVIIVEQRNYSDCKLISEELELIANANTRLIGAIVI